MGAAIGSAAMMGMASATTSATEAMCRAVACSKADCIAMENGYPLQRCNLTKSAQCACVHNNGLSVNVTCAYCVVDESSGALVYLVR